MKDGKATVEPEGARTARAVHLRTHGNGITLPHRQRISTRLPMIIAHEGGNRKGALPRPLVTLSDGRLLLQLSGFLLFPDPRVQPQPPARKVPLMRDPNPRHAVPDPEGTGECKEPLSVSYTKDDHREADANADYRDQDRHKAGGKGEVREIALQRCGLRFDHRPEVPRRTGPLRMELSIRQFQAAGRFRFDNYKTDFGFLFPRTVSAILGHRLLNTISQDFPRGNLVTLYATDVHFYRIPLGLILRSSQGGIPVSASTTILLGLLFIHFSGVISLPSPSSSPMHRGPIA